MATMTPEQIRVVRQLWNVVKAGNLQETGVNMYLHMFTTEPEVMKLFSFVPKGVTNPEDLRKSDRFLRHAMNVMNTVTVAVDGLDDMDSLSVVLIDLGKRHKKYKAKYEHLPVVGRSLTHTVKNSSADAYTQEAADAFAAFYGVVGHYTGIGINTAD